MEIASGKQAGEALIRCGLLMHRDLPIDPEDVIRWLQMPDTFAAICFNDGIPTGYVVGCKRPMERDVSEMFILQAYGDGGPGWVTAGWQYLQQLAAKLGCHRIGVMLPMAKAPSLCRRFGFTPE